MKYYLMLLGLFGMLFFGACSSSKKVVKNTSDLRQEAKDFSLNIIESYFNSDCEKLYDSLSDSILLMDGDGIIAKNDVKEKSCKSVRKAIYNKEKTFQDYLNDYTIEVLTSKEAIESLHGKKLPDYYITTDLDYFFLGGKLKEGKQRSDNWIWNDMFIFMVRKENGVWKVKGATG